MDATLPRDFARAGDVEVCQTLGCPVGAQMATEIAKLQAWEKRAVASMDAASKAAGVSCCDLIPAAVARLRAELAAEQEKVEALRAALVVTHRAIKVAGEQRQPQSSSYDTGWQDAIAWTRQYITLAASSGGEEA